MMKKTTAITFSIVIASSFTAMCTIENQTSTNSEIRILQEQIRTQHAQNETQLNNLRADIASLQKKINPLSFKRMGKIGLLGLAGYGAYNLYQDYLQSSYKPMVDQQAQTLFNLISAKNSEEKTTAGN